MFSVCIHTQKLKCQWQVLGISERVDAKRQKTSYDCEIICPFGECCPLRHNPLSSPLTFLRTCLLLLMNRRPTPPVPPPDAITFKYFSNRLIFLLLFSSDVHTLTRSLSADTISIQRAASTLKVSRMIQTINLQTMSIMNIVSTAQHLLIMRTNFQ